MVQGSLEVIAEIDPGMEQGLPCMEMLHIALLKIQFLWWLVLVGKADTVSSNLILAFLSGLSAPVFPDSLDLDHTGRWSHNFFWFLFEFFLWRLSSNNSGRFFWFQCGFLCWCQHFASTSCLCKAIEFEDVMGQDLLCLLRSNIELDFEHLVWDCLANS